MNVLDESGWPELLGVGAFSCQSLWMGVINFLLDCFHLFRRDLVFRWRVKSRKRVRIGKRGEHAIRE